MRAFFLLLLLTNAGFFAYGWMARERAEARRPVGSLQVHPEKIRLLKPGERPGPSGKGAAVQTSVASAACVEWGAVAGPDVGRADAAIAALNLPDARVQRTVLDAGGYWVYLPPAKGQADLERSLGELSALGVTEFFVVQDSSPWRNAISLGIFKTEEAARSFLNAVQAKGLNSAIVGRREKFLRQIAYFVREPSEATVARIAQLQREFPGTQMKAVACPPFAEAR